MSESLLPPIVALAPGHQATVRAVWGALRQARTQGSMGALVLVVPQGCMHGLLEGVASICGAAVYESAYLAPGQAYVIDRSLLADIPELVAADAARARSHGLVTGG